MDDAVVAALEIGRERRQPAGEVAEKAVVEPSDPGLCGANDMAALAAGPGHDLQVGHDVDDPQARDQVTLHRARQLNLEPPGDEVDEKRDLPDPFRAGEPQAVA